ncbi:MAG: alpha-glucosidase, partial [Pseudomonadota bacterium]
MTKIVLVGAGSVQFGCGTLGDIFTSSVLDGAEIALHDIDAEAVGKVLDVARAYVSDHGLSQTVTAGTDLKAALQGADFVIISIEVGDRFALWEQDWRVPQQYGINQVYGENGGPGGLFHALRIIPPILDICQAVMDVAPDATVFNYSNPMSRICTTAMRKFPELKLIGMCHEIASLERHLAPLLGVDRSDLHYRAAGLNHFSVLLEATVNGRDVYDDVRAKAPAYFSSLPGYSELLAHHKATGEVVETEGFWNRPDIQASSVRPWSDRWLFAEVLERFGMLPITTDSHFGEYITWAN